MDSFGYCKICGFCMYFQHGESKLMCPSCWNMKRERVYIFSGTKAPSPIPPPPKWPETDNKEFDNPIDDE